MTLTTTPEPEQTESPNDSLHISVWVDPLVDRLGHDPRSTYVEQFWLGILGPSTVWFLRHCAGQLDAHPTGVDLSLPHVASLLGLGHRGGRNSPMARAVTRACRFGCARSTGTDAIDVRRRLPPLNRSQIERLPLVLQQRHHDADEAALRAPDLDSQRARARRLALGLIECGDPVDNTELQLGRWRFHPSIAAEAVRWAWDCHHGIDPTGPQVA
jgi:hypothetical protein